MPGHEELSDDTRRRVLMAGAEIFAEKGFDKTTIREIVERADANLNAVNYYFRDKRGLYFAVFEHAHQHVTERDQQEFARIRDFPPTERLRAFVLHMLRGLVLRTLAPWQMRLMVREMSEPTGALVAMVEQVIRPRFEGLCDMVRELLPPDTPALTVRLCAESVIAQCIHLAHARSIVTQLLPDLEYTPEGLVAIADHIADFSLAALRSFAEQRDGV
ncbi:MAG: CerR family C-terminal domain-containing protein [Phycisphaerae bacterium]|jgi:AcrR family transcriptional regulator